MTKALAYLRPYKPEFLSRFTACLAHQNTMAASVLVWRWYSRLPFVTAEA
jgi:hypothetical protein